MIKFRNRNSQNPHQLLEEAFGTLRELELHLKFFNLGFSNSLWLIKVAIVGITVLGGFSAIRIFHRNPFLGLVYISLGLANIISYVGVFQFAYKVTDRMKKLVEVMEVTSARLVNSEEKKYWKRRLKSVPRMGMSLGGFNRVEREAVPIFADFCVKQIVTLLITFK